MLQLYYNSLKKLTDKYEELEMDTDSLYLALSEENLEDVILPKERAEWDQLRSEDCTDNFTANAAANLFPQKLLECPQKNMMNERRVSSKKSLDVQKCCVSVAKHFFDMINRLIGTSLAAEDSKKEHWKTVAMDQFQSFAKGSRTIC